MDGDPRKPRGPSRFRQSEIERAIKGAEAAGKTVYGIRLVEGQPLLILSPEDLPEAVPEGKGWADV